MRRTSTGHNCDLIYLSFVVDGCFEVFVAYLRSPML